MDTDPALEGLMSQLGDFGSYQLRQHLLHILSAFLAGIHMLSLVTVAPVPEHRCHIDSLDGLDVANLSTYNTMDPILLSNYIPINNGEIDECHQLDLNTQKPISCINGFVYDKTYYKTSRVINWNLVCEKRWERALIQSIYMFGVLMGAIILGSMADKYGRKTIFYISGIFQLLAGLASAFIPNFIAYCCVLFFYGMFGSGGAYVTGFVLTMELVGPKRRTLCGTAFSAAFAVGVMVVAFWGFLIRDYEILQVVYALHSLVLIGHWWLVDESIRWLWGQGRTKEAIAIVEKGVKINGNHFDRNKIRERVPLKNDQIQEESKGVTDLFKKPTIRKRALTVAFVWFANSLVYYGLSLNTGNLLGNPFLMLFLVGLAEVPGYLMVILLVDITGRRSLCSALLLLGGFACLLVSFIPQGLTVTILVMIGKMAIAGSFAITYNYTAELFPTVVRNSAVGIGACSARFSGMLTPMITLLDSIGKKLPTIIFGTVSIVAALLTLLLPETLNKEMPQTMEDGERFGRGDTGYKTCMNCIRGKEKQRVENNTGLNERLHGVSHTSSA